MMQAIIAAAVVLAALEGEPKALNEPAAPSRGPRVDDLVASGFVVVKDTKVVGDFDGCERGRAVQLAAGVFTCSGFGYMHASTPKAGGLKSADGRQFKLVVGGAVFDGAYL